MWWKNKLGGQERYTLKTHYELPYQNTINTKKYVDINNHTQRSKQIKYLKIILYLKPGSMLYLSMYTTSQHALNIPKIAEIKDAELAYCKVLHT